MSEWDTKEWREIRDEKLFLWFNGNVAAMECYKLISTIAEEWDDIVDDGTDAEQAVENALVHLPLNAFYMQNFMQIHPMIVLCVSAWKDSNAYALSPVKEDLIAAYFLRNLGLELCPLFAYITGGWQNMRNYSLAMREFWRHESFEEWVNETKTQTA